jgi:nitronate monooxygenase
MDSLPLVIQGGMGAGVSGWKLARAVSTSGQLGVVSGTGIDAILARRLQLGDSDGSMRRALAAFPLRAAAERILARYFQPGGKAPTKPFKSKPMPAVQPSRALAELTVAANFVEVFLAKEGHSGLVGLNLLEKIQVQTLPSLYGAMLARVDFILMGAGIPRFIPNVLDLLSRNRSAELPLDVVGSLPGERFASRFDPQALGGKDGAELGRPKFLAVVSSATLAGALVRRSEGAVDGFVVEGRTAGGHNAPPRGSMQLDDKGEPLYGEADEPDLAKFRELGLPFWLAGSYGSPERLSEARREGAAGVQVGTLFALCRESGIEPALRRHAIAAALSGSGEVRTDPLASPTGFPFKVMRLVGTLSDPGVYARRKRICDLGYLRQLYRKDDGSVGFRCAAEPEGDFVAKGGSSEDSTGRKCLCNGLLATIGLGQVRQGEAEPPIVTIGDDVLQLARFMSPSAEDFSAEDVLAYLLREERANH